jgi:hypothetical protein
MDMLTLLSVAVTTFVRFRLRLPVHTHGR